MHACELDPNRVRTPSQAASLALGGLECPMRAIRDFIVRSLRWKLVLGEQCFRVFNKMQCCATVAWQFLLVSDSLVLPGSTGQAELCGTAQCLCDFDRPGVQAAYRAPSDGTQHATQRCMKMVQE